MFETLAWVRHDKSTSEFQADVKEDRFGIEFETGYGIKLDDLIRRKGTTYAVYEVLGNVGPFTVRCEVNR